MKSKIREAATEAAAKEEARNRMMHQIVGTERSVYNTRANIFGRLLESLVGEAADDAADETQ